MQRFDSINERRRIGRQGSGFRLPWLGAMLADL